MLGKLIRYEIRATAVPMLLCAAGVIVFAALTGLFMWLTSLAEFMTLFLSISMGAYMFALIASYILVLALIVMRFYKNIYGKEGYITLTLPVRRWKLIVSKLLVSVMWMIVNAAAIFVSLLIVAVSFGEGWRYLGALIGDLGYVLSAFLRQLKIPAAGAVIGVILLILITMFMNVLLLYASVSIGQLFKKHRIFGSVLGYMMLYTAAQMVLSVYVGVFGAISGFSAQIAIPYGAMMPSMNLFHLNLLSVLYLVIILAITLLYYIITRYVINRAVNLQ